MPSSGLWRAGARGLWRQRLWLVVVLVAGCRAEPEPAPLPEPPSAEQIRSDLVGVTFAFFEDADGPRPWTVEADEIRRLRIVDQVLDDSGRVARSRVALTLRAASRQIRGELDLRHVRADSAWVLDDAVRAGPNWTAGDAEATLYAVEALTDSTGRRRVLAFDLIARYVDGRYASPLAAYDSAAFALAGAAFGSDSLRRAALDSLSRRAAASVVRQRQGLFVLGPGQAPLRATVDSVDADLFDCVALTAYADPPTPEAARWAALGTTSSVMGTPLAEGGPVGRELARALLEAARERLQETGADATRIRQWASTAADLDGDGRPEAVGAFSTGGDDGGTFVAVAVEASGGRARTLFARRPAEGYRSLHLLGVVDVDADGAAEALFLEDGADAYRYLIVTYRGGRYTDAFRGGGGACP